MAKTKKIQLPISRKQLSLKKAGGIKTELAKTALWRIPKWLIKTGLKTAFPAASLSLKGAKTGISGLVKAGKAGVFVADKMAKAGKAIARGSVRGSKVVANFLGEKSGLFNKTRTARAAMNATKAQPGLDYVKKVTAQPKKYLGQELELKDIRSDGVNKVLKPRIISKQAIDHPVVSNGDLFYDASDVMPKGAGKKRGDRKSVV